MRLEQSKCLKEHFLTHKYQTFYYTHVHQLKFDFEDVNVVQVLTKLYDAIDKFRFAMILPCTCLQLHEIINKTIQKYQHYYACLRFQSVKQL